MVGIVMVKHIHIKIYIVKFRIKTLEKKQRYMIVQYFREELLAFVKPKRKK